jgi:hypothetical protein
MPSPAARPVMERGCDPHACQRQCARLRHDGGDAEIIDPAFFSSPGTIVVDFPLDVVVGERGRGR